MFSVNSSNRNTAWFYCKYFVGGNFFCGILNLEVTGSELNSKLRLSEMKLDKIWNRQNRWNIDFLIAYRKKIDLT